MDGKCSLNSQPHCTSYDEFQVCNACTVGYFLDGSTCNSKLVDNYAVPNFSLPVVASCVTCKSGYYSYSLTQCLEQNVANCAVHKPNQNKCLTCIVNFSYVDHDTHPNHWMYKNKL
jgi:hypothetical protein